MKKNAHAFGIAALVAIVVALVYFFVWPVLSPTMSWSRFVGIVEAALREDNHPVITLHKRVLSMDKGDSDRLLTCAPNQSVTIIGRGQDAGDFNQMWIGPGDISLQNVHLNESEDGGRVRMQLIGAVALTLRLDEDCVLRYDSKVLSALYVDMREIEDGASLRIENAGAIYGFMGIYVRGNNYRAYQAEILNTGSIVTSDSGIFVYDDASGGDSRVKIVNTGIIWSKEESAVRATLFAKEGNARIDLQNDGVLWADTHKFSLNAVSEQGKASIDVHSKQQASVHTGVMDVSGVASEGGQIYVNDALDLLAPEDGAFVVSFEWGIKPDQLQLGWDADGHISRAALRTFVLAKLKEYREAVFPPGTEINIRASVAENPDAEKQETLYEASFTLRVAQDGTIVFADEEPIEP